MAANMSVKKPKMLHELLMEVKSSQFYLYLSLSLL